MPPTGDWHPYLQMEQLLPAASPRSVFQGHFGLQRRKQEHCAPWVEIVLSMETLCSVQALNQNLFISLPVIRTVGYWRERLDSLLSFSVIFYSYISGPEGALCEHSVETPLIRAEDFNKELR